MKKFLSVILIFLASFGFTAKLMQLDKFSETELMAKECNKADEQSEKEKKEQESKDNIAFTTESSVVVISFTGILTGNNNSFNKGFASRPYTPPDIL